MNKKYHNYTVKLGKKHSFRARVPNNNVQSFTEWINNAPGVSNVEEIEPIYGISGESKTASKIATARKNAKLKQAQVAKLLGVGLRSYQRWEYGEQIPSITNLMKIGALFGIDWTTLVD